MTGLMPIGVFARATRLSVRVLRNYDRLGLLVPAWVDPGTGYRRYGVDQFARAGLIRRLRELEVPLPEIAEILAADTPQQARLVIERHRERVAVRAARLNEIAGRLGAVLAEPERVPGWLHVYERWRPAQPTARMLVRTPLSGLAEALGPGFTRLFAGLAEQGIAPAGPVGTRYLGDDLDAAELTVELFVPVGRPPRPTATIAAGELTGCLLAATVHEGGYDDIETAYRSLGRWIAEQDRVLAGPAEECYLVPPAPGVPTAALRTEVAWPVRAPSNPTRPADQDTE
ncbi:MerR family transcriptional regulator [Micromonospora eburnea]|uniref:DNA-binding transcriptional regulator, MerR family n=1 Tax=Micromonospora eburnea TaxID=227316 RepID=A0A1C6UKB2_9ACTN|nr:MerR family transcriptional regulator [Micromonospora eburnea]SCL54510.1 DNA-binding transcriptional regulator, MerR family [Micromonospora eburnea]